MRNMYILLLVSFLFISFLSFAQSAVSDDPFGAPKLPHPLEIDKRRMFCDGDLPRGRYGDSYSMWNIRARLAKQAQLCGPDPWSAVNFTTLADLCTAHGNPKGNMGGMCSQFEGPIYNPELAVSVLLWDQRIESYCRRRCFCPHNEDMWLNQELKEVRERKGMTDLRLPDYMDNPRPPMMGGPMILSTAGGASAMRSQNPQQGSMTVNKPIQPKTYHGPTWICHTPPGSKELACACKNPRVGSSRIGQGQLPAVKRPLPIGVGRPQGMPLKGALGM